MPLPEQLQSLPWRRYASIGLVVATMLGGFVSTRVMSKEEKSAEYSGDLPVEPVTIEMQGGGVVKFDLEVVQKPVDLEMGLMYRKSMGKNQGMLFEMSKEPRPTSFWMKNTLIPLDMLFIASDGKIINIHKNAHPQDLTPIPSNGDVTGVIELNGSRTTELNINTGDRVVHPWFSQDVKK